MSLKLKPEQSEQIVQCLLGTCQSEHEIIPQFDFLEAVADDEAIDAILEAATNGEIERCDQCSWWVEISEVTDGKCSDCAEEDEAARTKNFNGQPKAEWRRRTGWESLAMKSYTVL